MKNSEGIMAPAIKEYRSGIYNQTRRGISLTKFVTDSLEIKYEDLTNKQREILKAQEAAVDATRDRLGLAPPTGVESHHVSVSDL